MEYVATIDEQLNRNFQPDYHCGHFYKNLRINLPKECVKEVVIRYGGSNW